MNFDWLLDSPAWESLRGLGDYFNPRVAVVLSLASLFMLLGSLFVTPWLLLRLPANYFLLDKPPLWTRLKSANPLRRCLLLAKNVLGVVCVAAGILMLVLPGQGLLTIVAGLFLLDFHGKKELERRLIGRPSILKSVNWLRQRYGKPPFQLDDPA